MGQHGRSSRRAIYPGCYKAKLPMKKVVHIFDKEDILVRPNYFNGQLLTAEDFSVEQEYFIEKQRRHNRYLHGWGVVSGFIVSVHDAAIVVEPGIAIDCAGNEILLNKRTELPLPSEGKEFYVIVEYRETKENPIPVLHRPGSGSDQEQAYSRILEGCHVGIADLNPNDDHDGVGPGTPGCGCPHAISIACLRNGPKRWKVSPCARRRA